jgi:hypothetical protein
MSQVFNGKVEFQNSQNQDVFIVDTDSGFFQLDLALPGDPNFFSMRLTNTGSLTLWDTGDNNPGARVDGSISTLYLNNTTPNSPVFNTARIQLSSSSIDVITHIPTPNPFWGIQVGGEKNTLSFQHEPVGPVMEFNHTIGVGPGGGPQQDLVAVHQCSNGCCSVVCA